MSFYTCVLSLLTSRTDAVYSAPSTLRAFYISKSSAIDDGQRNRKRAAASTVSNSSCRHFYSHRSVVSLISWVQLWYVARSKEIAVPISHCRLTAFVVCSPCSRQLPMVREAESRSCLIRNSKSFFIRHHSFLLEDTRNQRVPRLI